MTLIHSTAVVDKSAEIGEGVEIGPYSVVGGNVKLGAGTKIMSHVVLDGHTTIGKDCHIFPFASIGTQTQDLKFNGAITHVEVGDRTTLREYVTVNSSTNEGEVTKIGTDCHIMAYCHVAHLCTVGNEVIMANCATLAGHVIVEDQAIIGGLSGIHQFCTVGRLCMVGGLTKVTQDCPPFMTIDGNPAEVRGLNSVGLKRRGIGADARKQLKEVYRILYRKDLSASVAVERIKALKDSCPEVQYVVEFVENSERGIVK